MCEIKVNAKPPWGSNSDANIWRRHHTSGPRIYVAVRVYNLAVYLLVTPRKYTFFWIFTYNKFARPNRDANSLEEGPTDDTNSLRNLAKRSSNNCDL